MTTARERMKTLSGLLGAHSAREHFLAITQGTGGVATAGALLVSSSPLSTATAAEHLMAERTAAQVRMETSPYIHAWRTRDTLWHASPTVGYLAIGRRLSRQR